MSKRPVAGRKTKAGAGPAQASAASLRVPAKPKAPARATPPPETLATPKEIAARVRAAKIAEREAQEKLEEAQVQVTESMKAAAIQNAKRKGTILPKCMVGVASAADVDKIEWRRKPHYGVFMDRQNFSCIRVGMDEKQRVSFIRMTSAPLSVERVGLARFEDRWKPYIYPLLSAAKVYAEGAKVRGITEEAREHLSKLLGKPLPELVIHKPEDEGGSMSKKDPEMTVTTVKDGKKVTLAKIKGAPPREEPKVKLLSREEAAKIIKAGGKITKARDNDRRKGSAKAAALDTIMSCKTVAEALKATYKFKGIKQEVSFSDVRSAVRRGYVIVSKK